MAATKRNMVPIGERQANTLVEMIKTQNSPNFSKSKVSQWLSETNVKAFNKILLNKAFSKPISLTNSEELLTELQAYFQTCYDCEMVPTVSNLATWLGIARDTLYSTVQGNTQISDTLRQAIDFCHSINENGAISGNINTVLYMFLSKNYYGMKDNSTLNLTTGIQDATVNNTNTMKVIQEQIALEHHDKTNLNMSNTNETK